MDTSSALEHPDSRYFEAMEPAGPEPATSCLQSAPTMSRRVAPCRAVSDIYPGTAGTARGPGSAAAQPCGRSLPRRLPRSRGNRARSTGAHCRISRGSRTAIRRAGSTATSDGSGRRGVAAQDAQPRTRSRRGLHVRLQSGHVQIHVRPSRRVSIPGAARTAHASVRSRGTIARCGSLCSRLPSP
jgi:hypothetical protein